MTETMSETVSTNREAMLAKLAELDTEQAKAVAGGGEKYVGRHHARGAALRSGLAEEDRHPVTSSSS